MALFVIPLPLVLQPPPPPDTMNSFRYLWISSLVLLEYPYGTTRVPFALSLEFFSWLLLNMNFCRYSFIVVVIIITRTNDVAHRIDCSVHSSIHLCII
jgi:hypothetical protein